MAARRDPLVGWLARLGAAESVSTVASALGDVATPESCRNPSLLPPFPVLPAKTTNVCTEAEAVDLGELPERRCQHCGGRVFWQETSAHGRRSAPWRCEECDPPDPDQWRDATCLPAIGPW
jgi:DNA-directed RNA polymerase subunit RPC12/RpoP